MGTYKPNNRTRFQKGIYDDQTPHTAYEITAQQVSSGMESKSVWAKGGSENDGGLSQLARALAQMNHNLDPLYDEAARRGAAAGVAAGAEDFKDGKAYNNKKNSRAYQDAYYKLDAEAKAGQMRAEYQDLVETKGASLTPDEFKAEAEKIKQKYFSSTADPVFLTEFVPRAVDIQNKAGLDYQTKISAAFKQENLDKFGATTRDKLVGLLATEKDKTLTPKAVKKIVEEQTKLAKQLGISAMEARAFLAETVGTYALTEGVEREDLLDYLEIEEDGIRGTDNLELAKYRFETKNRIRNQRLYRMQLEEQERELTRKHLIGQTVATALNPKLKADPKEFAEARKQIDDILNNTYNPVSQEQRNYLEFVKARMTSNRPLYSDEKAISELWKKGRHLTMQDIERNEMNISQEDMIRLINVVTSTEWQMLLRADSRAESARNRAFSKQEREASIEESRQYQVNMSLVEKKARSYTGNKTLAGYALGEWTNAVGEFQGYVYSKIGGRYGVTKEEAEEVIEAGAARYLDPLAKKWEAKKGGKTRETNSNSIKVDPSRLQKLPGY